MLVYGKRNSENTAWELYGTKANVPSESDAQLTYKDIDGDTLTLVTGDKYFDDGKGGIIRQSDEKFMGVFINGETKAIIPNGWEPETKEVKKIVVKTAPTKTAYTAEDKILTMAGLVLTVTYKDGDKLDIAYGTEGITYNPAEGTEVTASGDVIITFGGKTCKQAITFA